MLNPSFRCLDYGDKWPRVKSGKTIGSSDWNMRRKPDVLYTHYGRSKSSARPFFWMLSSTRLHPPTVSWPCAFPRHPNADA